MGWGVVCRSTERPIDGAFGVWAPYSIRYAAWVPLEDGVKMKKGMGRCCGDVARSSQRERGKKRAYSCGR